MLKGGKGGARRRAALDVTRSAISGVNDTYDDRPACRRTRGEFLCQCPECLALMDSSPFTTTGQGLVKDTVMVYDDETWPRLPSTLLTRLASRTLGCFGTIFF